jgi:lipopolysaccharide/colanic/teichoic acid biosynthesis glycosyltransferase
MLGFEGNFRKCLKAGDKFGTGFQILEFSNSFTFFKTLQSLAERRTAELPKAIICELELLQQENFLFTRNLKSIKGLKSIPFIALSRGRSLDISKSDALKLGIDDLYFCPVDQDDLENRLDFLVQFKPGFMATQQLAPGFPNFVSIAKRSFDLVFASIILLCISPILLIIAMAIKLESRGPLIYRSKRVGTGYQVFDFLKFRSMYKDADKRLVELQHINRYGSNEGNEDFAFMKFKNDPRVTRVGKVIRRTSLDELPQLFNVLKGDMSIVGNRPLPLYEAEKLTRDEWARRFLAPAGLTGLWQVAKGGKDNMTTEERIKLDIEYAKNHSFGMDMSILARTLPAMLQRGE